MANAVRCCLPGHGRHPEGDAVDIVSGRSARRARPRTPPGTSTSAWSRGSGPAAGRHRLAPRCATGAVGEGRQVLVDDQAHREGRLEIRLVPAREGPPGVGRLELGDGDDLLGAVVGRERAAVEAVQLVVEDAREAEVQAGSRRRARAASSKAMVARCASSSRSTCPVSDAPAGVSRRASRICSSTALQTSSRTRFDDVERDDLVAVEPGGGQVGRQFQLVAPGRTRSGSRYSAVSVTRTPPAGLHAPRATANPSRLPLPSAHGSSTPEVVTVGHAIVDVLAPSERRAGRRLRPARRAP